MNKESIFKRLIELFNENAEEDTQMSYEYDEEKPINFLNELPSLDNVGCISMIIVIEDGFSIDITDSEERKFIDSFKNSNKLIGFIEEKLQ